MRTFDNSKLPKLPSAANLALEILRCVLMQHLVFACARLVHLEFASAPDLYLGFPDMLRDALGVARSATLTHSELLLDEKNALRFLKCAFAHLKFPRPGKQRTWRF